MTVVVPPRPQRDLPRLAPDAAKALPTWRAAYSDRTAALMADLCEMTYAAPGLRPAIEARLDAGGFNLAAVTGRALLAVSADLAVLAFRGTNCVDDWRLDLSARRVPLPSRPELRVHRGFLEAFLQDQAAIEAALTAHWSGRVGLYIAGHSLGGALAQIAAAEIGADPVVSDRLSACYTFGSPRVGTLGFAQAIKVPHYRVVNAWDVVPGVPAPFWRGYRHTGDPRLLTPGADAPLARDRSVAGRLAVDVAAALAAAVTHKLPVVDDHMIWNYRARLDEIAAARAPAHAAPAA